MRRSAHTKRKSAGSTNGREPRSSCAWQPTASDPQPKPQQKKLHDNDENETATPHAAGGNSPFGLRHGRHGGRLLRPGRKRTVPAQRQALLLHRHQLLVRSHSRIAGSRRRPRASGPRARRTARPRRDEPPRAGGRRRRGGRTLQNRTHPADRTGRVRRRAARRAGLLHARGGTPRHEGRALPHQLVGVVRRLLAIPHVGRRGEGPDPGIDGWNPFREYVAGFISNERAREMFADHVRFIVGRTNRYTNRKYSEDPAIFSWQICNEPRAFSDENKGGVRPLDRLHGPSDPLARPQPHDLDRLGGVVRLRSGHAADRAHPRLPRDLLRQSPHLALQLAVGHGRAPRRGVRQRPAADPRVPGVPPRHRRAAQQTGGRRGVRVPARQRPLRPRHPRPACAMHTIPTCSTGSSARKPKADCWPAATSGDGPARRVRHTTTGSAATISAATRPTSRRASTVSTTTTRPPN